MSLLSSNGDLRTAYEFLVDAEPDETIPACDAIFVFGTHNGDVARHAARLYAQGKAPMMVVSGKYGNNQNVLHPDFATEAEYLSSIAVNDGVPRDAIVQDPRSTNTYENVMFGMKACDEAGLRPKTLVLVATPYLLRRAKAYFKKHFPEVRTYGSAMTVDDGFFTPHRIERIKGEFPRFVKYAEMGTIDPISVPDDVARAARELSMD